MSLTTIFPFENPSNYSFDSNKIEISGGQAQLKLIGDPNQPFEIDFANLELVS